MILDMCKSEKENLGVLFQSYQKEVNNEELSKKDLMLLIANWESCVHIQCPKSVWSN